MPSAPSGRGDVSSSIRLAVRELSGNLLANVCVHDDITVAELKTLINQEAGMDGMDHGMAVRGLTCGEERLNEAASIRDLGLSDGSEVFAITGRFIIGDFALRDGPGCPRCVLEDDVHATFSANGAVSISFRSDLSDDRISGEFQYHVTDVLEGLKGPEWRLDLRRETDDARATERLAGHSLVPELFGLLAREIGHVHVVLHMDSQDPMNRMLVISAQSCGENGQSVERVELRDVCVLERERIQLLKSTMHTSSHKIQHSIFHHEEGHKTIYNASYHDLTQPGYRRHAAATHRRNILGQSVEVQINMQIESSWNVHDDEYRPATCIDLRKHAACIELLDDDNDVKKAIQELIVMRAGDQSYLEMVCLEEDEWEEGLREDDGCWDISDDEMWDDCTSLQITPHFNAATMQREMGQRAPKYSQESRGNMGYFPQRATVKRRMRERTYLRCGEVDAVSDIHCNDEWQ